MKAAYADPPYPGQARRHYSNQLLCKEVNHRVLIGYLCSEFDAWALSTSSVALQDVLAMCPANVRVGAWVKPFASFKPGVNPAYAWEPVVLWQGQPLGRDVPTVRDWVSANITLRRGLAGAKPAAFCQWLFQFMGLQPKDELVDIFPGTGTVAAQWQLYQAGAAGHTQMILETTTALEATHAKS